MYFAYSCMLHCIHFVDNKMSKYKLQINFMRRIFSTRSRFLAIHHLHLSKNLIVANMTRFLLKSHTCGMIEESENLAQKNRISKDFTRELKKNV